MRRALMGRNVDNDGVVTLKMTRCCVKNIMKRLGGRHLGWVWRRGGVDEV